MNNNDAINTLREIKDIMQKSSRFQTIGVPTTLSTLRDAHGWP